MRFVCIQGPIGPAGIPGHDGRPGPQGKWQITDSSQFKLRITDLRKLLVVNNRFESVFTSSFEYHLTPILICLPQVKPVPEEKLAQLEKRVNLENEDQLVSFKLSPYTLSISPHIHSKLLNHPQVHQDWKANEVRSHFFTPQVPKTPKSHFYIPIGDKGDRGITTTLKGDQFPTGIIEGPPGPPGTIWTKGLFNLNYAYS